MMKQVGIISPNTYRNWKVTEIGFTEIIKSRVFVLVSIVHNVQAE